MNRILVTTALSFVVAVAVVRIMLEVSRRRGLYDIPNERSSHSTPTPRTGGVGITIATLAGIASMAAGLPMGPLVPLLASALVIAIVSLVDDLRSLSVAVRLTTHVLCAVAAVAFLRFGGHAGLPLLALAVVWTVGCTNAFNFMDGIDGIAAGQAIVTGIACVVAGVLAPNASIAIAGASVIGAAGGFAVFNRPPAKIFMGDCGSAFLGFLAGTLSLYAIADRPMIGIIVPLSLWPFLFDSTVTFVRRGLRGERVYQAHRTHIYQRLVASGFSHGEVAMGYTALAASGVLLAALAAVRVVPRWVPFVVLLFFALGLFFFARTATRAPR